jgi:DNA-binding NarL/FixJ family response regulator
MAYGAERTCCSYSALKRRGVPIVRLPRIHAVVLSPRERQILQLLATGMVNKDIAAELHLEPGTIKVYLHHLFLKIGLHTRLEAVLWYQKHPDFQIEQKAA